MVGERQREKWGGIALADPAMWTWTWTATVGGRFGREWAVLSRRILIERESGRTRTRTGELGLDIDIDRDIVVGLDSLVLMV